mmetsp:Transcript_9332/g.24685  ORF Transcript_9332/g.24685 Transcript_9332/m.24685 type:complete len:235 (-) Transcript_9332:191-895(-)
MQVSWFVALQKRKLAVVDRTSATSTNIPYCVKRVHAMLHERHGSEQRGASETAQAVDGNSRSVATCVVALRTIKHLFQQQQPVGNDRVRRRRAVRKRHLMMNKSQFGQLLGVVRIRVRRFRLAHAHDVLDVVLAKHCGKTTQFMFARSIRHKQTQLVVFEQRETRRKQSTPDVLRLPAVRLTQRLQRAHLKLHGVFVPLHFPLPHPSAFFLPTCNSPYLESFLASAYRVRVDSA